MVFGIIPECRSASLRNERSASPESPDKIKIVATGTGPVTIQCYFNNTLLINYSDSTYQYTGGSPGAGIYDGAALVNGNISGTSFESWAGGDGDGTGVVHPTPPAPYRIVSGGMSIMNVYLDSDGMMRFNVVSPTWGESDPSGTLTIGRYYKPTSPAAGKPLRFLHFLAVENTISPNTTTRGDPMLLAKAAGFANSYNAILFEPLYHDGNWVADSVTQQAYKDESFLANEWIPWVKLNFGVSGNEENWIMGFSRTGFGGTNLILKHQGLIARAALWDLPGNDLTYAQVLTDGASSDTYGSQTQFDTNYSLTQTHLNANTAFFKSYARLWYGAGPGWGTDTATLVSMLTTAGAKTMWGTPSYTAHEWETPWMSAGVAALDLMYQKSLLSDLSIHMQGDGPAAPGGGGIPALVSHTSYIAGVNGGGATPSINTTGANFIVVAVSSYTTGPAATLSDNKSNTWTPLTLHSVTGGGQIQLYYSYNPTVGAGHTFSLAGTGIDGSLAVAAFSGVAASPFDVQNGATYTPAAGTYSTGSITPTVNNELLIAAIADGSGAADSINSAFNMIEQQYFVNSANFGVALAFRILGTAAAINPNWTVPTPIAGNSAGESLT
jgi:hypothetical protein